MGDAVESEITVILAALTIYVAGAISPGLSSAPFVRLAAAGERPVA